MSKFRLFLKSGQTIDIECDEWQLSHDDNTLEFDGYKFKGFKNIRNAGFVPSQIARYIELK